AATARVSVALAGDEVLSIKRGIQLPEPYVRQSRSDGQKALAFSGLLGLPAVVLLMVGIVRSRRLPMVATDDLPRRSLLVMLLAFALTSVASSAQSVPSSLALYDTAVPWRTFLVSAAGTQAVSLVGVFVVA